MINKIKNFLNWGILIIILWGFFYLFKGRHILDIYIHLIFSLAYAAVISFNLFLIKRWLFPRLNAFPQKMQFIFKSFFFAAGTLIAYLIVFLAEALSFTKGHVLLGDLTYRFFYSISILFSAPVSDVNYNNIIPEGAITVFTTFIALLLVIALGSVVLSYVDTRWNQLLADQQLRESRLKILEMQMKPHFLFNTLNTIVSVVKQNPRQAETLLINLSDFLRFHFNSAEKKWISIAEEIEFIRSYLTLIRARFGDFIDWNLKLSENCAKKKIPIMLLQPLVENTLKYSYPDINNPLLIELNCRQNGPLIEVTLKDNGPGIDYNKHIKFPPPGHSLKNIEERLKLIYRRSNLMKISSEKGAGTTVRLSFPQEKL